MNQEVKHLQVVRIHIDKQVYESPTPTTGAALYLLAHVPPELQIFDGGHRHEGSAPIPNDATPVELKGGEHFRTGKRGHAGTNIFVNTAPYEWERPQITYDELVQLAFPDSPIDCNVRFSITWSLPGGSEGAVLKGGKVKVADGMTFDVRNTDKS